MRSTALPAPTAAPSERAAVVGNWRGALSDGATIEVSVPEVGNPIYRFQGEAVPVRSVRMAGSAVVLTVGTGGGTVTLTPAGAGLDYAYRFRGQSASARLSRS